MKIGFLGMLTLLFAAAKVFGYITWSWWVVFSPMLIVPLVLLFVVILSLIAHAVDK